MKINKAYKFRLEPNAEQEIILNNLVGSARFVWNQILAISFEMFAKNEYINATSLVNKITDLKNNPDFSFLKSQSNAGPYSKRFVTWHRLGQDFSTLKSMPDIKKIRRNLKSSNPLSCLMALSFNYDP